MVKKIVNDITEVTFKQLTEKEIDFYINHNKVLDKAPTIAKFIRKNRKYKRMLPVGIRI